MPLFTCREPSPFDVNTEVSWEEGSNGEEWDDSSNSQNRKNRFFTTDIPVADSLGNGHIERKKGNRGRWSSVVVNYINVTVNEPKAVIFHYKVRIEPEPQQMEIYRKVLETIEGGGFIFAFDGRRNLYTRKPISAQKKTAKTISLWDAETFERRKFNVILNFNQLLRYKDALDYIAMSERSSQALPKKLSDAIETILNEAAVNKVEEKKLMAIGKKYFLDDSEPVGDIGGGTSVYFGFNQSLVFGRSLYLAFDLTFGYFFDPLPVIDVISYISGKDKKYLEKHSLDPGEIESVRSFLKGVKIVYRIAGSPIMHKEDIVMDVIDISNKTSSELRLMINDPKTLYALKKGYLMFPNMPCLVVGCSRLQLSIPAERCVLTKGQHFNRPLNSYQKHTLKELFLNPIPEPNQIKDEIHNLITTLELEKNKKISEFDLNISKYLVRVMGRVLKPPTIICKSSLFSGIKKVSPVDSAWDLEHFEKAVTVSRWAVCCVDPEEDLDLNFFATALRFRGLRLGMRLLQPQLYSKLFNSDNDVGERFEKFLRERKSECCEVVIVIMPDTGALYGKIKQIAELHVGMLTQCLKSSTIKNLNIEIMNSILQKLNAKLNGNNHNIKASLWPFYFVRPTLVIGATVDAEDPNRDPMFPVIASIVGSCNRHATKYNVQWSFLKSNKTYIEDFDNLIVELLTSYYQENKTYPEKILYFRDGISKNNFLIVLCNEIEKIKEGCAKLQRNYRPTITFIEVTRNHPTMFFPGRGQSHKYQSHVPVGTVVDNDIVHPAETEFYLMSHISQLGLPKPTKYHVLFDDAELSENDLQAITFYLCHLCSRCTRSISFPAPLYYAHLASHRVHKYLDRKLNEEDIEKVIEEISNVKIHFRDKPMFFI